MVRSPSKRWTGIVFLTTAALAVSLGAGWFGNWHLSGSLGNATVLSDTEMATVFGDLLPAVMCKGSIDCSTGYSRTADGNTFCYRCGNTAGAPTRSVCCSNLTVSGCNPNGTTAACKDKELWIATGYDTNNIGSCGELTCSGFNDKMMTCNVYNLTNATGSACGG